jgi:hypothetical protein
VATDPSKIADILHWSTPQNVSKLRGFIGLIGYYRRFVQNYPNICKPLHEVLRKNAFQWTEKQEEAFVALKQAMTSPPVLALPDFLAPFVLETDASGYSLGAVLMQQCRPLAFLSKTLGVKAFSQSIYEKESMAILEALRKWRHYLLDNKLIIKTDQKSLKYLTNQRLVEGIQHKLMLKLLEFDYTIEYKQGKVNSVADALSRKSELKIPQQVLSISAVIPQWMHDVEASYQEDPKCRELLQSLAINSDSHQHYSLQSGILRYKNRVVIGTSTDLRTKIFDSFCASIFGGHSGQRVTLHRIKQIFYWPNICQLSKTEHMRLQLFFHFSV